MVKNIEVDNNQLPLEYLYKVMKIDMDKVTFKKYETKRPVSSLVDEKKSIIELDKEIGEEIHICTIDVIYELASNVGMIIKGFKVSIKGKTRRKVIVTEIHYI